MKKITHSIGGAPEWSVTLLDDGDQIIILRMHGILSGDTARESHGGPAIPSGRHQLIFASRLSGDL